MPDGAGPADRLFDVFISYARENIAALTAVIRFLEDRGYKVDWDKRLTPGEDWQGALQTKIKAAKKVIALWSGAASQSEVVAWEMSIADGDGKLVPLWLDDTPPKSVFARRHHLKVTDFETEAEAIIEALGIEPSGEKPATPLPAKISVDDIWLEGLPTGTRHLFGRETELATLLAAWESGAAGLGGAGKTNAVVLHAIGGAGKSALLRRFLDALEEKGWPGADKVYGWSAYSQGSGENRNADADTFIAKALGWFGHDLEKAPITDPVERGRTLARLIRRRRTLLVLDGLEPLQDLPEVNDGRLKDRGLKALVEGLARENPGLVVITSRQELPELAKLAEPKVINHTLENLSEEAGAGLLKHLGVHGREKELRDAVREVGGHALSVSLLGTYLSAVCAGVVARRDTLRFHELVDTAADKAGDRQARRAQHIMDAYVERFAQLPAGGADTERLILSLIGLFDRPAEADALVAVLAAPPIPGLTEAWHALPPQQQALAWTFALQRLRALKLIAGQAGVRPAGSDPIAAGGVGTLDAHPVVRQHFGRRLKEAAPVAFVEANRRLYEHYKALPEKLWGKRLPDTLPEMQPLFAAIAHGCAAGLHQEVHDQIWLQRLRRGNEQYIIHKLGAVNAALGALAHFFDPPWGWPHPSLRESDQAVALNFAGFALRALGRLREAVEPMRANIDMNERLENWRSAAANASNLGELLLMLGDVGEAVAAAREGVAYADKSGDAFQRMINLSTLADALHQAGDTREAEALFTEAERLQKERQPELPRLYSLPGYRLCDLLLGQGRHAEVAERADYAIEVARRNNWLLDMALDSLSLGRVAHLAWRAARGRSPSPRATPTPPRVPTARGEGRGEGQRQTPTPEQAAAPHPNPLPAEERGEGTPATARQYLDAAVEGLRKAGTEHRLPWGLLARAAFRRDGGDWDRAREDLDEAYEIAGRGGMRLHLANQHLERARLELAQIAGVAPPDAWTLALRHAGAAAVTGVPAAETPRPAGWWAKAKAVFGGATPARTSATVAGNATGAPAAAAGNVPRTLAAADRGRVAAAAQSVEAAATLIADTVYHRRDAEVEELRALLAALAAK
jgi:tetratricopeptide (TPR) repeat protein